MNRKQLEQKAAALDIDFSKFETNAQFSKAIKKVEAVVSSESSSDTPKETNVIRGVVSTQGVEREVPVAKYSKKRLKKSFNPVERVNTGGAAVFAKGLHPRTLRAKAEGNL